MNGVIKKIFWLPLSVLAIIFSHCSSPRHTGFSQSQTEQHTMSTNSPLLQELFNNHPVLFDSVLQKKDELNIQVIYTQINRDPNDPSKLSLTDHFYNVNSSRYFYPASTVKLPIVALALQRLNELNKKGLDKNTTMITEADGDGQTAVHNDPSAEDGRPTIANYIKKILLVSDNDAFNRLYEFLGQEYINKNLHRMGYKDVQIIHRLAIFLTEDQNRHTNPIRFVDTSGNVIYQQKAKKSRMTYRLQDIKLGQGYINGKDQLVKEPFDFTYKNRLFLADLHMIVRSIIFPQSVPKEKRFDLTEEDYAFLYKYMGMYPREAGFPPYDPREYPDTFVKKLMYGNDSVVNPSIRYYNKTGTAYGFHCDAAYIKDEANKVEFFLTVAIYCNSDGIFNDDKYDYDTVGYPFLQHIGQVMYDYERNRVNVR
jgi:cell division protein FtsI/penicillin-binding protein 2